MVPGSWLGTRFSNFPTSWFLVRYQLWTSWFLVRYLVDLLSVTLYLLSCDVFSTTCNIYAKCKSHYHVVNSSLDNTQVAGRVVDFEIEGGIAEDLSDRAAWTNGILMNRTLAALEPGMKWDGVHVIRIFVSRRSVADSKQNIPYDGRYYS